VLGKPPPGTVPPGLPKILPGEIALEQIERIKKIAARMNQGEARRIRLMVHLPGAGRSGFAGFVNPHLVPYFIWKVLKVRQEI
jgi:hypothetical protein